MLTFILTFRLLVTHVRSKDWNGGLNRFSFIFEKRDYVMGKLLFRLKRSFNKDFVWLSSPSKSSTNWVLQRCIINWKECSKISSVYCANLEILQNHRRSVKSLWTSPYSKVSSPPLFDVIGPIVIFDYWRRWKFPCCKKNEIAPYSTKFEIEKVQFYRIFFQKRLGIIPMMLSVFNRLTGP